MSFYNSISEYYREIFPLKPMQAVFVKESFADPSKLRLLDVGCGTGDLSLELSGSFRQVNGIDLDAAMLKEADKSATGNIQFEKLDMLDIHTKYGEDAFDGILCFGNTLVHLYDLESIAVFFKKARKVLVPNGKLLLQIINYDRILDQDVKALPTIETGRFSFVRKYHYNESLHRIEFETLLNIKESGKTIRSKILLYPLRKSELHSLLMAAGFNSISYFGDFRRSPIEESNIPFVLEAS